jgi:lysyl-tRNA synthetase class 1
VAGLTEAQRIMLAALAAADEGDAPDSGAAWQDLIFGTSQTYGVSSGDAFAAIYLTFLGRTNGPRAGWLLASLERGFVTQRLRDAAGSVPVRTPSELAEETAEDQDR